MGCDWLPCRRAGECVCPFEFKMWRWIHPVEYRRERKRIKGGYRA